MFKRALITFIVILMANCGGKQRPNIPDPKVLIRHGEYERALKAAKAWVSCEPNNVERVVMLAVAKAVFYASKASEKTSGGEGSLADPFASPKEVKVDLSKVTEVLKDLMKAQKMSSMVKAVSLFIEDALSVSAFDLPERFDFLAEVIKIAAAIPSDSKERRELGAWILETVAYGAEHEAKLMTLKLLWSKVKDLIGKEYKFPLKEQKIGWRWYLSASRLVIAVDDKELRREVGNLAVSIVENNPTLAIAVRCDLASPYDLLKKALYWEKDLRARLEHAVREAEGCTPGTYAPGVAK